jgi:hypothetical protein
MAPFNFICNGWYEDIGPFGQRKKDRITTKGTRHGKESCDLCPGSKTQKLIVLNLYRFACGPGMRDSTMIPFGVVK